MRELCVAHSKDVVCSKGKNSLCTTVTAVGYLYAWLLLVLVLDL